MSRISQRSWAGEEENILKTKYPSIGAIGVSKLINRDIQAIRCRASVLGIRYEGAKVRLWKGKLR